MRILCYVNHYYGEPIAFSGRSTDSDAEGRHRAVSACLEGLRRIEGAEVQVCGISGRSLEPVDIDFPGLRSTPSLLVYESLAHMAGRIHEGFDYFINIEDDILLPAETLANTVEFDRESLPNEVFLPNRLEYDEAGQPYCLDWRAMPGWTNQRRRFRGREIRVAHNPHSGVLILSPGKFRYALRHLDAGHRGRSIGAEMASAYAYYHSPFCLYRSYDDLSFHNVFHLDQWAGPRSPSVA